jgi:hypothetical protein
MATSLTLKCSKISKEKSWQTDEKGNSLNRHTIEFEVGYDDEPTPATKQFSGSTMTLVTMDKKVFDSYKVGDEYTLTIKK